ncbi:MAG: hypothetical protein KDI01_08435 [Halioglobus sp.]|nr:hypothetical protein [Halioglobus sp.]
MALCVAGCEAPLDLSGVQRELAQPVHRYDQLQALARNGAQVVVVGGAGVVLVSQDDGHSWQRRSLPGQPALIDVSRCPDGRYVALDMGRQLWISDSAAANWQAAPIETGEAVLALTCDTRNRIWVVGGFSTILSTADDGASWSEYSFGDDMQLTAVQFLDADTGYVTGEFGLVLKTTDGGASWEQAAVLPGDFYSQDAVFIDARRGWAVGLNGAVFHTDDGGGSWQTQDSGTNLPLYGIAAAGDTLFAVGENGIVMRYREGAWQRLPHDNSVLSYLRGVSPGSDTVLLAGGNGTLFNLAAGG